jgi:hypothetical protein
MYNKVGYPTASFGDSFKVASFFYRESCHEACLLNIHFEKSPAGRTLIADSLM